MPRLDVNEFKPHRQGKSEPSTMRTDMCWMLAPLSVGIAIGNVTSQKCLLRPISDTSNFKSLLQLLLRRSVSMPYCRCCDSLRPSVSAQVANRTGVQNNIELAVTTSKKHLLHIIILKQSRLPQRAGHVQYYKVLRCCLAAGHGCDESTARRCVRTCTLKHGVTSAKRTTKQVLKSQRVCSVLIKASQVHLVVALHKTNLLTGLEQL